MIEFANLEEAVSREFDVPLLAPVAALPGLSSRFAYGRRIGPWLRDAIKRSEAETVACLIPARTDTRWWWDCRRGEIRFLRGRVRFPGARNGAPFPSAVVIFGSLADSSRCGWWDVNRNEINFSRIDWNDALGECRVSPQAA